MYVDYTKPLSKMLASFISCSMKIAEKIITGNE